MPRSKYLPSGNRGIPVPKHPRTIGEHLRRRRLELNIFQTEAARKLGISTVTLSRWECDKGYPTWPQQAAIVEYLGHNPFADPLRGSPKRNETGGVAFLSSNDQANIGEQIVRYAVKMRKTLREFAKELGILTGSSRKARRNVGA